MGLRGIVKVVRFSIYIYIYMHIVQSYIKFLALMSSIVDDTNWWCYNIKVIVTDKTMSNDELR